MERPEGGGYSPTEKAEVYEMTNRVQSAIDFYEDNPFAYGRQRAAFEKTVKDMSLHDQMVLAYSLRQIGMTYGMYGAKEKKGRRYRDRVSDLMRFVRNKLEKKRN